MLSALEPSGATSLTLAPRFSSVDRRLDVRVAHREEQRREAAVRLQLEVGARFEQHVDRGGVAFGRRPHQRRLTSIRFLRVDRRAARQQQPHGVRLPRQRRRHQHRLTFLRDRVRVSASLQQALHDRGVAVDGGEIERRDVVAGGGLGVGAGAEQQLDELQVVPLRGPVESGEAVRLGGVDVDLLFEEGADRLDVLLLDGVDQW